MLCEKDNAMTLKQSEEIAFRNLTTRFTMHEVLCPSEDNEISQSAATAQAACKDELKQQEAGFLVQSLLIGKHTDLTCRSTGRGPIILHEELRAGWLEKEAADSRGLLGF